MKVGDVVRYRKVIKPTPADWRGVLYGRIGIVTEVCGTDAVYVRFEGVTEDLISMTIMIGTYYLDIVSEA